MSVEQFQEGQVYGQSTDIWAAGVVLYELFTKKLPFKDIPSWLTEPFIPLPEYVPSDIKKLIGNMLDRDPTKRMTARQIQILLNTRGKIEKKPSTEEVARLKRLERDLKAAKDEKSAL